MQQRAHHPRQRAALSLTPLQARAEAPARLFGKGSARGRIDMGDPLASGTLQNVELTPVATAQRTNEQMGAHPHALGQR